jgi:hypothetical protein
MADQLEIFLFVDALGWELVERTGFLAEELPYRRPARMQFGYSCSAIPTILSGTTPAQNGHLSYFNYAPNRSPFRFFRWLRHFFHPRGFWERGRVRHWLSKAVRALLGYTGYFQLYRMPLAHLPLMDYAEKRDLFQPGGLDDIPNLADALAASGLNHHISDWHLGDRRNLEVARELVEKGELQFAFIYTAQLDGIEHDHIREPDSPAIQRQLDFYAEEVRGLLAAARARYQTVHFTLFSDHGMTPLRRTFDVEAVLNKTGLKFNVDYVSCIDSTLLRIYYLKADARPVLEAALANAHCPGHWLSPEEEKRNGIYRADRRFGDELFLAEPGVQFAPSDMGAKPLNGMHGYDPDDRDSTAAILSNIPIPDDIREVPDYFRLMQRRIRELAAKGGGTTA